MSTALDPFTVLLDVRSGMLEPELSVTERRLSDMRGLYLDGSAADHLAYRVLAIPVPELNSELQCSTTILQPGLVGDEYMMTKGHFHAVRDRSEIYIGLSGEGRLVMATEDGRHAVEPIRPGTVNYIPGGWAHRSVNVGDEPLIFFAAYVGDAGHDYATVEERGFPVLVVRGPDGPQVVPNPRYQG
ncbi:MAG TPA: glucose-6-phosphate isomerase family protein [Candidatus Limnocylindria bacterium]|nr:glucose-6-phosphate isomerase family protein [Candidatus Limnocylindria bacterium]